jgi:hypothetical protein
MIRHTLSESNIRELLALKHEDITLEWLKRNFACVGEKVKMPQEDEFILSTEDADKLSLPIVKSKMTTTAGRFIVNYFMLGNAEYTKYVQYINEPWDKKIIGKVMDKLGNLLLEKKISERSMVDYIDRQTWMGYAATSFVTPGINMAMFKSNKGIMADRDRLVAENEDSLRNGNIDVGVRISNELNKKFEESQDNNPGMDYIKSKSAKNVLGVTAVSRGMVPESKDPSKVRFIKSSLQEGIQKNEIAAYADIGIAGAFSRGVQTQKGGYIVKQYNAAFAHVEMDEEGSDCKTKETVPLIIDKNTIKDYFLRYCYFGGKEILLTEDNINTLMGKTVRLRTPLFCTSQKLCSKCMGELYYRMGIRNVGFLAAKLGSSILNQSLKSFHDATIKSNVINIDEYVQKI